MKAHILEVSIFSPYKNLQDIDRQASESFSKSIGTIKGESILRPSGHYINPPQRNIFAQQVV